MNLLINRALINSSEAHENILDLFGGLGSTLIGAEMTRRKAFIMEMDPKFVDVIIKRWENYTKEEAHLVKEEESNETRQDTN